MAMPCRNHFSVSARMTLVKNMQSKASRACDRCYSLKERCISLPNAATCGRCSRLGFVCLHERPEKRVGRPKKSKRRPGRSLVQSTVHGNKTDPIQITTREADDASCLRLSLHVPRVLDQFDDLTCREKNRLRNFLLDNDVAIERFLLGPSFRKSRRDFVISQFFAMKNAAKEAYLAVAFSALNSMHQRVEDQSESSSCYMYAAVALMKLRELQVDDCLGVSTCLNLGGLLLTFALCSNTVDVTAINRHALRLVKPFYESDQISEPQEAGVMSYWILVELMNCILHGSVPLVRFRPTLHLNHQMVDPTIGVCGSILPYFDDICRLGHDL